MPLSLILNGTQRRFDELKPGDNLLNLIEALELAGDRVALEHNEVIASRASWGEKQLAENDRIELVHFVGGGVDI